MTVTVDAGTARVTVEFAAGAPLVLAGDVGGIPPGIENQNAKRRIWRA